MKKFLTRKKWKKIIKKSGLFDTEYYLFSYPEVRQSDIDPIEHFIKLGAEKGFNPSDEFDTSFYLKKYPDVNVSKINPLVHYLLEGKKEGRLINNWKNEIQVIKNSNLFDEKYYLSTYKEVNNFNINPIEHFVKFGVKQGNNPSPDFDTCFYLKKHKDVRLSGMNPFVHYCLSGKKEKRQAKEKIQTKENKTNFKEETIFNSLFYGNNNKSNEYVDYKSNKPITTDIKLIAFYLPQFHPIAENDRAWGKGFTEWTNVSKAIPQFSGHYQPRLPGELGYYDLRLIDIQKRQIELAKNYGLHGFCYHYYWFAGKKILDKPIQQILDNKELDFPFCINWANENWTKRWDGLDQEVILKQKHSEQDDIAFIEAIKPILTDKRYIKINGKALLMVYRPQLFPDITNTVIKWREHAKKIGIGELYLVLCHSFDHQDPREIGFDAATEFAPNNFQVTNLTSDVDLYNPNYEGAVYDYKSAINYSISLEKQDYTKFKSICPGWDNEARKPGKGTSFINSTPQLYSRWLEYLLHEVDTNKTKDEKIIFINAWNEWAEGAYLEPDRKYGYAYLQATYQQLSKFDHKRLEILKKTQKQDKTSNTAVIVHLHYIDLWEEIIEELKSFNGPVDLYVSINSNASITSINKIINSYPTVRLYSFENRGRDIYPFILLMKQILFLKYKYACKIHSKKSLHRADGDKWRNHLIKSLIGSEERIKLAKKMLDQNTGIVVARGNIFSYKDWIGSNHQMVESFAKKSKIELPVDFNFPAGSMFWFKPEIMSKLVHYFDDSLLEVEDGQIDGTKAHAVERIFGLVCKYNNFRIEEI